MIDLKTLVTYAAVVLGLFLVPGPAVLMTVGRAASGGRRVGVATGLGVAGVITAARAFRQAVLAELLNPKTALFFLAFLPQFVHRGSGPVVAQLATLGLLFACMSAIYTSLIALGAGAFARLISRHRGIGKWQGKVVGSIYIALGARLALQER